MTNRKWFANRPLVGLAIFLVAGLASVLLINRSQIPNDYACSDKKFADKYYGAKLYLSKNVDKLGQFADEIEGYNSYERSPNCMHALTMLAINSGDSQHVEEVYTQLRTAYDETGGYVGVLNDHYYVKSPDELKSSVELVSGKKNVSNGAVVEWKQ